MTTTLVSVPGSPLSAGEPVGTFGEVINANAGTNSSGSAPVITPTFASATAAQLADTSRDYVVYFTIATGGGTVTIAIGPTSTPAHTIVSGATGVNGAVIPVRLPAGWYLKITVATSTIGAQVAVGC
jgi:hypothetical protein